MGAGRGKHASGMRLILNLWTPPYPPVNLFLIPVTRFLDSLVILHRYTYNSVIDAWLHDLMYQWRWMHGFRSLRFDKLKCYFKYL